MDWLVDDWLIYMFKQQALALSAMYPFPLNNTKLVRSKAQFFFLKWPQLYDFFPFASNDRKLAISFLTLILDFHLNSEKRPKDCKQIKLSHHLAISSSRYYMLLKKNFKILFRAYWNCYILSATEIYSSKSSFFSLNRLCIIVLKSLRYHRVVQWSLLRVWSQVFSSA